MTNLSKATFDELLSKHSGVPANDPAFDSALERTVQHVDIWEFSKALRDAVNTRPTPRGWTIAGYALAASGYLEDAIAALRKGRQSNTTHEVIASCLFVAGNDQQAILESKRSPDSGLHEWYRIDAAVAWNMSLVYILERPPVFGAGPRSPSEPLQLVDLAVQTLVALVGADSDDPATAMVMQRKLSHLMNVCKELGLSADAELLVKMMRAWQAAFQKSVKTSSMAQAIQELSSGGRR